MKRMLLFTVFLSMGMCINAVIPELEVWRKGDIYRYFFKDIHADYLDAERTLQQHNDIVEVARQIGSDGFVLVEDSGSQIAPKSCKSFEDCVKQLRQYHKHVCAQTNNATKLFEFSPISLLQRSCQEHGIKSHNVECLALVLRYGVIKNGLTDEQHVSEQQGIINRFSRYLEKIKGRQLFSDNYDGVNKELIRLKSIPSENVESFLTQAFNTRCLLLEARALHKLALLEAYKHGFIFMGNTHIERIKPQLSDMGYNHVKTVGVPILQILGLTAEYVNQQTTIEEASELYKKHFTSQVSVVSDASESVQNGIDILVNSALDIRATMEQVFKEQS